MDTCSACLTGLWKPAVLLRLMDICTVCQVSGHKQAYGHLQCLFVRLMDTHSACLSGLWTPTVLVCQAYGHPQCWFVRLMDTHSACLSGLWTPTVLVRLMDTCSACQAYGHLQCLCVRLMDTHSACQAYVHLQCLSSVITYGYSQSLSCLMDTLSVFCHEFDWACSPGCQILLDTHNPCQSCWVYTVLDIRYWTLAVLSVSHSGYSQSLSSVLVDTCSLCHQS